MLRRIRIPVQLAFLAIFFYLLIRTLGTGRDTLGPPVRIFLEIDPLIAISTWLRTHALTGAMGLALITFALTFLLGRFFCGWICPLGTLSQITLRSSRRRREERSRDGYLRAQRWKYLVLVFVLAGAATGALWSGILDPISISVRSIALGFGPAGEACIRGAASFLASTPASGASEPIYRWIRDHTLAPRPPHFEQGLLLASLFIGILALSWVRRRFWCRVLCPLGGLLGLIAQGGSLTLRQRESTCTECTICTFHCQGAADPDRIGGWRPSECYVCGNCTSSCRKSGLSFALSIPRILPAARLRLVPRRAPSRRGRSQEGEVPQGEPGQDRPRQGETRHATASLDVQRRRILIALGLGAVASPIARATPSRAHPVGSTIRPPGAGTEDAFLDRCIRCGECMKVCIGNGLHPAGLDEGPLGLWAPVLRPRIGYCEYECTLCGQVCPTGAIRRLTQREKEGTVIGLAWIDTGRCLPFAYATPCIVCEEQCPTSPKAIVLEDVTATTAEGETRDVRRPRVDPHRCVGCGICEFRCPLDGNAAIRVFATGREGDGSVFDLFTIGRAEAKGVIDLG